MHAQTVQSYPDGDEITCSCRLAKGLANKMTSLQDRIGMVGLAVSISVRPLTTKTALLSLMSLFLPLRCPTSHLLRGIPVQFRHNNL